MTATASPARPSQLKEFWRYFSENHGAVAGLVLFVALVVVALAAPLVDRASRAVKATAADTLQRGADGVILCGCHPGDCHYTSGNYYTRRRMSLLFSMLDYLGIERERTRVEWVSAAEGAKFAATMNDFAKTVAALGENKRLEDLRCKK